jgi:hypothetical protein
MTATNDVAALEAEMKRLSDEIAGLSPRGAPKVPGRPAPSGDSARLVTLNRQLATVKLKLAQASKARGNAG